MGYKGLMQFDESGKRLNPYKKEEEKKKDKKDEGSSSNRSKVRDKSNNGDSV